MRIWTDGACEPNPGIGGWGWHRDDGAQGTGGAHLTTNNRMEMTAILEAMRALSSGASATIYSDSQYCVNGLTVWRDGWKKKSWKKKGEPMKNRDLWVALDAQLERLSVRIEWVRGHNGDHGNERADMLANIGRNPFTMQTLKYDPAEEFRLRALEI